MYLANVLNLYKKYFGFWVSLKKTSSVSKIVWVIFVLYFLNVLFMGICIYYSLNQWMILSILIFIITFYWANLQGKYIYKKIKAKDPIGIPSVNTFENMMKELNISSKEHLLCLDKLIQKEIRIIELRRLSPFGDIIKQLFLAFLITGVLAHSFHEFRLGNIDIGTSYLSLFIGFLGLIIMLNGIIKTYIDFFGRTTQLMEISSLIELQILSIEINQYYTNTEETTKDDFNARSSFPPRKSKRI